jgi:comEA protein
MFNLEKLERSILIFLILALCLGLAALSYNKSRSVPVKVSSFDTNIKDETGISPGLRVDINEADEKELMRLEGIGPILAGNIAEYRSLHGSFTSIDEIKKVKGIGESLFNKIKDKVVVE